MKSCIRIKYFRARALNPSAFEEISKGVYREEIERERKKKQYSDNQKILNQLQDFLYIAPKFYYVLEVGSTNSV
jgi:hypothetical protein